ncbi:MAG: hypothetical protein J5725_06495 [Bacteroidales bacterium]|nr:hypothetical protein [Bacteroidales bacterium]
MNKKEASARQEKMVSDYMGWRVVTGSGSRPFSPGDVNGEHFLVECKTHIEEQDNIVFYKKHWVKISEEAMAKHRYPALIVDNGTQKSKNTWVMIPKRMLSDDSVVKLFGLVNLARTDSTVTFRHGVATDIFRICHREDTISYFPEWCNGEQVAIMPLEEFRKFCLEEFGV